ncbi:hypothetical protein LTR08_003243 [Meristemomyces frigidus]|nr:hypothetical protein LTR08_003243 [Meristemomyces frigidus]
MYGDSLATDLLTKVSCIEEVAVTIGIDEERSGSAHANRALQHCYKLDNLRGLKINGTNDSPSKLEVGRPNEFGIRQKYLKHFTDFVDCHGKTLISLRLDNIVFTTTRWPNLGDVQVSMLYGLSLLKKRLPNLTDASVRLQRVTCCADCPDYVGNPAAVPSHQERRYMVKASDIEAVANELDVLERDGVWDFGEYIMRWE